MEYYKLMIDNNSPQVHQYISDQVNPFIQPLLCQLVIHRPQHALSFAIQWLTSYANKLKQKNRNNAVTSDSDSQDQSKDLVKNLEEKIQKKRRNKQRNSRVGISEEVFGKFNTFKDDLVVTGQGIDDGQTKLVNSLIHSSILFQNLDSKDEEIIRRAIVVKQTSEDELIIRQGEQGNAVYIVQSGEYDCYKVVDDQNLYMKTYMTGETFGELSLMYNAPRAASIVTKTPGKLLILDRSTFSQVLKVAALRKHRIIKGVIEKIQILKEIPIDQRHQFINILKEQKFTEGEYIIKEGEDGNKFYIVLQGQLVAEKQEKECEEQKQVYKYEEGDYFGELALLNDQKRQASIKAVASVKLAAISRQGFKRVFGTAEQVFKEQAQKYCV